MTCGGAGSFRTSSGLRSTSTRPWRELEKFRRAPSFVRSVITPFAVNRQKKSHYGQVLPIEEVERIFAFVNSVVRLPCICRQAMVGSEQRYCYGVSMVPQEQSGFTRIAREIDASWLTGPDTGGLEALSKEEALASLRELEKKGLCHTVWTFITPFIGGICNCDRSDCGGDARHRHCGSSGDVPGGVCGRGQS